MVGEGRRRVEEDGRGREGKERERRGMDGMRGTEEWKRRGEEERSTEKPP